jgi:arylformamidase
MKSQLKFVYRDYDQKTLDLECSPSSAIPNADDYLKLYSSRSNETRAHLGLPAIMQYGAGPRHLVDVFKSAEPNSPIQLFFHGGGWRILSKDEHSFVAKGLVPRGATVIVPSYSLLPDTPLDSIVQDAYAAVRWVAANATRFGGDPERIYVSGHSSGAHLAAMAVAEQGHSLPNGLIKGAVLVSGNYDLEPLRLSSRNRYMELDQPAAERNSPALRRPALGTPTVVACGSQENRQYKMQARDLKIAWTSLGAPCREVEIADRNHLNVVLDMNDKNSTLIGYITGQMGL